MSDKKIKVVLSGSGLKYPVHGGALHCLVDHGYEIEEICGVSGGAIVAAAVASGHIPGPPLKQLILSTLPGPNDLIDYSWLPFIWPKYGMIWGNQIEEELAEQFVPFFRLTEIPLHVITVNLSKRQRVVFSSEKTPDMSVAKAIRMSMSIPGAFRPVKWEGDLYVDGGVMDNMPLDYFGTGKGVIGLMFRSSTEPAKIENRRSYLLAVLDALMAAASNEHIEDAVWAQTVLLDTSGSTLDFGLDEEGAEKLWQDGYQSVEKWISEQEANNAAG